MNKTTGILIAFFVIAAMTVVSVNAATQYVSPSSIGSNSSCASPGFNTIQNAITAAAPGDTIYICNGTYSESPDVSKGVTLQGQSLAAIVNGRITIASDDVTVDGLTIHNHGSTIGIYLPAGHSHISILNNVISDVGSDAMASNVQAISFSGNAASDDIAITGNTISNIQSGSKTAKGIYFGDSGHTSIVTNVIISGNTIGTVISQSWGAYGILINRPTAGAVDAQVTDNTIDGIMGLWAHAIGLEGDTPNAIVTGNTIKNLIDAKTPSDAVGINFEDNPSVNTVTVKDNNFDGIPVGVQNTVAGTTVDATQNWWGSVSGPSGDGSGSGAAINAAALGATVNYLQFLCAEAPTTMVSSNGTCLSDHGSINLIHYNETASWTAKQDTLRVFGNAPLGAAYAEIKVRHLDQSDYLTSGQIPVGDSYGYYDGNYEHFFLDVSTWPAEQYQVVVFFYDDSHNLMQGYAVSAMFDEPAIRGLSDRITVLEEQVANNTENITYLMGQVNDLWDEIYTLQGNISDLAQRLDAVEQQLYGIAGPNALWGIIGDYCDYQQQDCSIASFCSDVATNIGTDFLGQIDVQMLGILSSLLGTSNEADLNLVWNSCQAVRLNAINHASISLQHFDADSSWHPDSLRVWGEAPFGATQFRVLARYTNMTVYSDIVLQDVATNQENQNTYEHFFDLSDWDLQKYDILVKFYDGHGNWMAGYDVGGLFDDLFLYNLQNQVNQTKEQIQQLNETLQDVNETLSQEIQDLWDETDAIWNTLDWMNHGTIEWRYYSTSYAHHQAGTFEFQGEVPANTPFQPHFWVEDSQGNVVYTTSDANDFAYRPGYPLHGDNSFWKLIVDASSWAPGIYTVNMDFNTGSSDDRWVVGTITELSVEDLQARMTAVEDRLSRINHGTINLQHVLFGQDGFSWLRVFGEAPDGATSAEVTVWPVNLFGEAEADAEYTGVMQVGQNDNAYSYQFYNIDEWPAEAYNVRVQFYDENQSWMVGYDVGTTFNDLLLFWTEQRQYGFDFKDTQYFEVWNQQDSFVRKISWGFTPQWSGNYSFEIVNPSSTNGQDIGR